MAGFGHAIILEPLDPVGETRWVSTIVSAHVECTKYEHGAVMSDRCSAPASWHVTHTPSLVPIGEDVLGEAGGGGADEGVGERM